MKQRKFQLESVLNYRKNLEEAARSEFANAKEALDREEKHLFNLMEKKEKYEEDFKRRKMQPGNPHELNLYHTYLQRLREEIDLQRNRVQEATQQCADRKEILLSVSKDKQILEKLKEHREDETAYQMKRRDKKSMDECAQGGRFLRNES